MSPAPRGGALRAAWLFACCCLATATSAADADGAGARRLLSSESQGMSKKADYSKHKKVPDYLVTSRKLVTDSWTRCKLACNGDKECAGFKFTPMQGKQLPSCHLLKTAGG